MTQLEAPPEALPTFDLNISGMTCAACAGRVERALNKIDGAHATVNYATERATITGLSPEASASAISAVTKAGYGAAMRAEVDDEWSRRSTETRISSLRRRLIVSAVLTIPLMDLTIILALVPSLRFPFWELLCVLLAIPIVFWAAYPFHKATVRNLRHGMVSMDTLVSLGILASFGWAVVTIAFGGDTTTGYWIGFGATPAGADSIYLDVAAGMTTFQLAGRYFETRSRRKAGDVLDALNALAAKDVRVLDDNNTESLVPVGMLRSGDRFVVLAGEIIAADGTVREGTAAIDTSMMTGEPAPRAVAPGDEVIGGTVSVDGRLVITATSVGAHTQLAQMAALAERAQESKARIQALVDRIVRYFVPGVITLSLLVMLGWFIGGAPLGQAFAIGIAVLIIACPCALGLATPTALMVGVGRGASLGILVKSQDALEASGQIDTVVLDKTGTVTTGRMVVSRVHVAEGIAEHEALRLAASVEALSEHPIARAVVVSAMETITDLNRVDDFRTLPGLGAEAIVDGHEIVMGSPRLLLERGIEISATTQCAIDSALGDGSTVVLLGVDGRAWAVFSIDDTIKASARSAVAALHKLGLRTVLLTGDAPETARRVADELGINEVLAGVLPSGKAEAIAKLQAEGRRVAMVGDGINDAAALATANLGMAMVNGTDIAMRSADIILVRNNLHVVGDAIALSRRTLRTIKGNLFWAFGYNIAAIPLAAAGLLNPLIAAAAMSLSSVLVVWNSLRLRSFTPRRESSTDA